MLIAALNALNVENFNFIKHICCLTADNGASNGDVVSVLISGVWYSKMLSKLNNAIYFPQQMLSGNVELWSSVLRNLWNAWIGEKKYC